MKIVESMVRKLELSDPRNQDHIRVYLEDDGNGRGRVTISCFDAAWVGYWGAMGCDLKTFFTRAGADCLATNMGSSEILRRGKHLSAYLTRIVELVQIALRQMP